MFKRTNKAWKALALVLALCMLSTIVVTAEPSTITLETTDVVYDGSVVTVTGTINVPETDVTILAVRTSNEDGITLANAAGGGEGTDISGATAWNTATLQQQVVYIDQETATEATEDNFEFSFIPRNGVGGQYITVFVGGANVETPQAVTILAAPAAPKLVPQKWYKGEKLVFDLQKKGDTTDSYDATGVAGWGANIDKVTYKVSAEDTVYQEADFNYNETDNTLELTFAEAVTAIAEVKVEDLEGTSNFESTTYNTAVITRENKEAGELTAIAEANAVVAGEKASIAFDATGAYAGWAAAINNTNVTVTSGSNNLDLTADDVTVDVANSKLNVKVDILTDKATATTDVVTVAVAVADHDPVSTTVAVIAPTANQLKADANLADGAIKVDYSATTPDDDATGNMGSETLTNENKNVWGQASITLPAAPAESGFTYTWTMTCADNTAVPPENAGTGLATGTAIVLDRPGFESDKGSFAYVLTLTVEDEANAYAPATKSYNLSTGEVGVSLRVDTEDVTVLKADAYGMTGKTLVVIDIPTDELDPEMKNMKIGDAKLYYSEAKGKYYGLVAGADAATIASSVEFFDGAAEEIYFGVGSSAGTALIDEDFFLSMRMYLTMTTEADVLTDKTYLAFDVGAQAGPDGSYVDEDFFALMRAYVFEETLPVLTESAS